ncbi:MAG: hypothetical protein AAGD33_11075 [Actinomycetota bacterium]
MTTRCPPPLTAAARPGSTVDVRPRGPAPDVDLHLSADSEQPPTVPHTPAQPPGLPGAEVAAPPVGPPILPPGAPGSGGLPPPGPGGPGVRSVESGDGDPRSSIGRVAGIAAVVLGIAALGWIALRAFGGDGTSGGSSSPEALAEDMVEAIQQRDGLAFLDLIAPDEFDGVSDIVETTTDRFGDLDQVLPGDVAPDESELDVEFEIQLDDVDVDMRGDSAAIVEFDVSGEIELGPNDLLGNERFDERFDSRDLPSDVTLTEMIAVRLDGRWFFSPMLTAGHLITENADLPQGDYERIGQDRPGGGDSPQQAVDAFVDAVNDPNARDLAGAIGGGEGRLLTVFEDALSDAIDDVDTSQLEYELRVETADLGSGRVELTEIELEVDDDVDPGVLSVEEGCYWLLTVQLDERGCLDEIQLFDGADTTIWLDTVREGGAHRVRIVPTFLDVIDRLLAVGERDEFLYAIEQAHLETPIEITSNSDVEITFDGELYVVHEFPVQADRWYHVAASDPAITPRVYVDDGFGLFREFGDDPFRPFDDGVVRVVTPSAAPNGDPDCDGVFCVPGRTGEVTLRVREGIEQRAEFPTIVSGQLGPSDVVVLRLDVAAPELVRIDVEGSAEVERGDLFFYETEFDVFDLPAGALEIVVWNPDPDAPAEYRIVPTPG